MSAYNFGGEWA